MKTQAFRRRLLLPLLLAAAGLALLAAEGGSDALAWGAVALAATVGLATAVRAGRTAALRERVLLVGHGPLVDALVEDLDGGAHDRYRLIGVVDEVPPEAPGRRTCPCLRPMARLGDIIEAYRPDRVVVATSVSAADLPVGPLLDWRFRGLPVERAVDFYERVHGKMAIEALKPASLLLSDGFWRSPVTLAAERLVSLAGAAAGLVVLAPLLALIAMAVRVSSPGPVLFRQPRVGRDGRPFALLKFRTMREDARPQSEWVRDNAHRITPVGRWLRRFRLDELPQLVNVVRGDMNLVGPRPHPVSNYELFLDRIPWYRVRETVRPGITGWAQVRHGYANCLEEETEKMRYDLYYIKHRSLGLDLRILLETLGVLAADRSAHEAVRRPSPGNWRRTPTTVVSR